MIWSVTDSLSVTPSQTDVDVNKHTKTNMHTDDTSETRSRSGLTRSQQMRHIASCGQS